MRWGWEGGLGGDDSTVLLSPRPLSLRWQSAVYRDRSQGSLQFISVRQTQNGQNAAQESPVLQRMGGGGAFVIFWEGEAVWVLSTHAKSFPPPITLCSGLLLASWTRILQSAERAAAQLPWRCRCVGYCTFFKSFFFHVADQSLQNRTSWNSNWIKTSYNESEKTILFYYRLKIRTRWSLWSPGHLIYWSRSLLCETSIGLFSAHKWYLCLFVFDIIGWRK